MANLYSVASLRRVLMAALILVLSACASGSNPIKPADLGANPALLGVRTVWTSKIANVDFPLQVKVDGSAITLAGSDGVVQSLDAGSGAQLWSAQVGAPISAGVGSDGRFAAVVTRSNELVVVEAGQVIWRMRLAVQVFTAPLVAGERVFVLGADRSVAAFDARSGRKLWQQQRPGEALVLRKAGVLMAMGNTLVAGLAGHLVGMNPLNGNVVWDATLLRRAAPTTSSVWWTWWAASAGRPMRFARAHFRPPWVASTRRAARSLGSGPLRVPWGCRVTSARCTGLKVMAR